LALRTRAAYDNGRGVAKTVFFCCEHTHEGYRHADVA
jgi:hypothetical protein